MLHFAIRLLLLTGCLTAWSSSLQAAELSTTDSMKQQLKSWLRQELASPAQIASYGLALPAEQDFDFGPVDRPLVVIVHGFNSSPEQIGHFVTPIRREGFCCLAFRYPNDHRLAASAKLLSRELKRLHTQAPRHQVAIVSHSMGGLVARAVIENPRLDPGCVRQLIMVAPPNHGTLLAHYALGTDLVEHGLARQGGNPWRRVQASFADGLAEALEDLQPGSKFLRRLNARSRNPAVRYSILLGTGALVYQRELNQLSRAVRLLDRVPYVRRPAIRFANRIEDMEEVMAGKGDGVVAVRRGTLAGVEDTVVLAFNHLNVTGPADNPATSAAQAAVLKRLVSGR